ncbi:MAG: flagellar hook-basal body complex protein [Planctomycetaceae bacterium]
MQGVQTTRIGLFLVLIATGVVVAHVLAVGVADSARQPAVVSSFELAPSPFRHAASQDDEVTGFVSLASLEQFEGEDGHGGVVQTGGCPSSNCCSRQRSLSAQSADCIEPAGLPPSDVEAIRITDFENGTEAAADDYVCRVIPNFAHSDPNLEEIPGVRRVLFESADANVVGASKTCATSCACTDKCPACSSLCAAACPAECPEVSACSAGGCSASACKSETVCEEDASEVITSDAEVEAVPAPSAPEALLAPDNATPIGPELPLNSFDPDALSASPKSDDRKEAEVRSVIEQELPDAREDEREIWLEELKGLPPEMVRELLRLRSDFNAEQGAPSMPEVIAPPPPIAVHEDRHQNLDVEIGGDSAAPLLIIEGEVLSHIEPTLAALRQASRVILNNIANANTTGFKRSSVLFSDAEYEQMQLPVSSNAGGKGASAGISIGNGAQIAATRTDFGPGVLRQTGRALDLAISGDGFFQVRNAEGQIVYTRAGTFAINADGQIVVAGVGAALEPALKVSANVAELTISNDGLVTASEADKPAAAIGQIQIARFTNPEGLLPLGSNLFGATDASGPPNVGAPAADGRGKTRQRHLEASNVNVASELIALQEILQQIESLQQATSLIAPGLALPPAPAPQAEPADDDGKPSRFTRRRHPQQTSEHIRPDRAKR